MVMPAARLDWTVDMVDALPDDGNRYEVIGGELFVTPAPSDFHQLVAGTLYAHLRAYMRPSSIGRAFMSPSDVRREDRRRNRVQPDISVVRLTENARPSYPFDLRDLLLAVEVESPGDAAYDYQTKRKLYLDAGVPEYWILRPEAQTAARWRGSTEPAELVTARLEWQPAGMMAPFVIDLPEFFEDAFG